MSDFGKFDFLSPNTVLLSIHLPTKTTQHVTCKAYRIVLRVNTQERTRDCEPVCES